MIRRFLLTFVLLVTSNFGGYFLYPNTIISQEIEVTYGPTREIVTQKVTGSIYWGEESQTDDTPTLTGCQKRFDPYNTPRWVALSKDLRKDYGGPLECGDTIWVTDNNPKPWNPDINGMWVVYDVMNIKWRRKIDFLRNIGTMGRFNNLTIKFYKN